MPDTKLRNVNAGPDRVPIDSIRPHPRNVNEGDVGAIHGSLTANGWYGRVLVQQSTNLIIAGKHRWMAAQQAGEDEVDVEWLAVDDDEAIRIMLVDNRTTRLGLDNESALAELLTELAQTDRGLDGTAYDGDDLDELISDLADGPGGGSDGSLLALTDVSVDEPTTEVATGDHWIIGDHHRLLVVDVMKDWHLWQPWLIGAALFVPYPGPYVPLSERADKYDLVMVQPDTYIAGHILDKYVAIHGPDAIRKDSTTTTATAAA